MTRRAKRATRSSFSSSDMPFSVMCSSIKEAIFSSDSGLGCLGARFTEIFLFISYTTLRGRFVPPYGKNNFFCQLHYPRRSSSENPVASCSTLTRGHGALRVVTIRRENLPLKRALLSASNLVGLCHCPFHLAKLAPSPIAGPIRPGAYAQGQRDLSPTVPAAFLS